MKPLDGDLYVAIFLENPLHTCIVCSVLCIFENIEISFRLLEISYRNIFIIKTNWNTHVDVRKEIEKEKKTQRGVKSRLTYHHKSAKE